MNFSFHPEAWTLLNSEIRRILVRRFPYGVLYSIEENGIFILAVMNLHRGKKFIPPGTQPILLSE